MSSHTRCSFLRVLTFYSKLEKQNEGILHPRPCQVLQVYPPHASGTFFPPHLAFSPKIATFFLPRNVLPLIRHVSYSLSHRPSSTLHPLYPPPSPSLYWFTHVCFGTFLSFILKSLRLPRNCYLCRACTARAMPAVENISCNPSRSSSERRRSNAPKAA